MFLFASPVATHLKQSSLYGRSGGIICLNYKFVVFCQHSYLFFPINDKIEPNKNGNLVDSSFDDEDNPKKDTTVGEGYIVIEIGDDHVFTRNKDSTRETDG